VLSDIVIAPGAGGPVAADRKGLRWTHRITPSSSVVPVVDGFWQDAGLGGFRFFIFYFPASKVAGLKCYLCAHQSITPGQSIRSAGTVLSTPMELFPATGVGWFSLNGSVLEGSCRNHR
jgi:hypothetical protein